MREDNPLEKGLAFLKAGNRLGALASFERAFIDNKTPELQSYIAFCIAMERGQISDAIKLCENAILQDPQNPVIYLNMAKVYQKAGNQSRCLEALRNGLSFGENAEIRALLEKLGTRNRPPFPFLSRSNLLNKITGIILTRLKLR